MFKQISIADYGEDVVRFRGVDYNKDKCYTNFAFELNNGIVNVNVVHGGFEYDSEVFGDNDTFKQLMNYLICKNYVFNMQGEYFVNFKLVETLPKFKTYTAFSKKRDLNGNRA